MTRKHLMMAVALVALLPAAACTTAPQKGPVRRADMTFADMAPLNLNVGSVQVIDNSGAQAQQSLGNSRVSPQAALANYARRRLKAVGGEGTLGFVIQQATLVAKESEGTGTWTDALQLSQPMEYLATMRIGLDLTGRSTQANVRSAYTLERKKILPAGTSLAERDRELNLLLADMVKSVDEAVYRGLSENLRVVVQPGPITFGQPAPLESSGSVVVPPVSPGGNPVIIEGRM